MDNRIFGLLGRRLGHSYSVPIHEELGRSNYRLFELEPNELGCFLKENDIGGLNVTIPYKKDVMKFCDVISPEAKAVESVNTVVRKADGLLYGYNTDIFGFSYMAESAGISFSGRKVLIFGSGGASRAVRYAAEKLGASEVITISRSGIDNYENLSRHYNADIIVNATPVGMYPNVENSITDISFFKQCIGVLDLVYNPRRTDFLMQAKKLGIPCADGLSMLVAQAKLSAEYFGNCKIPDSEIQRIVHSLSLKTENIVLIGMPGAGKNAVGEALAKLTHRDIIDIDNEIEKSAVMEIKEIFSQYGEKRFRELEHEAVLSAGMCHGKIIITGGGVVKDDNNYLPLHRNGIICHIERDISLLPCEGRPLSVGTDMEKMYDERLPLYKSYRDFTVTNDGTPTQTAEKIWRYVCENNCN